MQTINLDLHLAELSNQGWTVLPFERTLAQKLAKLAIEHRQNKSFKRASLSESSSPILEIRNDEILWLEAKSFNLEESEVALLSGLECLKLALKEYFRIHLSEIECHYAIYDAGHFYHRHSDATQVNNRRIFSFVIYLNENWSKEDAGQLIGYGEEEIIFELKPELGQMILFRSDIEHEVKMTKRPRMSVTGWFRK